MDIQWVRITSWHAARPKDHADSAYCGKSLEGFTETSDVLPAGKSCESCLRITRRIEETAAQPGAD